MIFTTETMQEILPLLQDKLSNSEQITFRVLDPDTHQGLYAGSTVVMDAVPYLYRGLHAWMELSEILFCRMLVPKRVKKPLIEITFQKLEKDASFHLDRDSEKQEKYGVTSNFFAIHKMEEPSFYYYYHQSLENVKIETKKRVLNLGINRGDEFEVIRRHLNINKYNTIDFIGIDHSETAIAYAKRHFKEKNVTCYAADINEIDTLKLGKFDLLISIGTLQSPSINFKPFLMNLVQNYLEKDSAIILGFPNSRWVGGEMVYGAKAPNYAMSEMSLLFNDVIFCKKYLQQKKYRVTITGKQYIFLTAAKIGV